jgi:UDP-glucose 4-epimerase
VTKALVTGGAGFLGSHVAERLLESGVDVCVLDDLSGGFRRNVPEQADFREGSILDADLVDALFRTERFRRVYHLAAYAAEGLSHFIRRFNYTNNVVGSANLITAAVNHGVEHFVFTSSAAVYGSTDNAATEQAPLRPEDPYGVAKQAVEQDLETARRQFGLRTTVFRPHNVYGERQNLSDPYRNVVGIFMRQALAGDPCTIFGDGEQTRAFSYVGDVTPVIADSPNVPEAEGRTFNIGSDRPCTVNELARKVRDALGREVGVRHLPERREARRVLCDHTAVRSVFGGRETTDLPEGLERMARWAEGVEPRPPRPFTRVEIARGLPPSWEKLLES